MNNPYTKIYILSILKDALMVCERQVLRTPTGPDRDVLCDVQIHIAAAISELEKLK